jgi:exodeoxyribonuclease VII small subunit
MSKPPPDAPSPTKTSDENPAESFEQALAALEGIVSGMERGDLPLEEALRQFEAGEKLVRRCRALLDAAEQRVETLLADETSRQDGSAH